MSVLAASAEPTSVGYSLLFAGVFIGSVAPVLPTGAVVGSAAAFAMTSNDLGLATVIALATLAALLGDLITFAVCRFGGPAAVRLVSRGQHAERIAEVRQQFHRHGWQILLVGRLLPAGRIPVLLAAGALSYPWRRLVPAQFLAALLWAIAYALLGVISGGIFDSPLIAVLIATLLVLVVGGVLNLIAARRRSPAARPGQKRAFGPDQEASRATSAAEQR
ncbi:hypothetical protein A6V29_05670 [Blastococcus sp. CCUG 61487]|nr:hypothetical protein A6V29_05670 [Blastococcus sp. CCUG 61487]